MKRIAFYLGIATAMVASCSTQEEDFRTPQQNDVVFYASFEQPAEVGTRVYANEDLLLRWTADDRVSIFNKITYNQEYKFLGETGDNAGGFSRVDNAEFVTGNPISHVLSVYPYQASTKITEEEVVTLTLPAEQHYAVNTFGLGDNTMVSVSSDNVLQYKSVGGFLRLSLYGDGVTVSSITLKGNNGEKLAGKATITMPLDGVPNTAIADDATTEITLVCDTPVALGATAEESKDFWLVVPPVTFSRGFTVTISGKGVAFEKLTENTVTIERNKLSKMAPIEVELAPTQPRNVIYYTSSDGAVVTPNKTDVFGASILSNEYVDGLGVITFDGDVTSIGNLAFYGCSSLSSITIPEGVTTIGTSAFYGCSNLTSITIPNGVTSIGDYTFFACNLVGVTIPDSVTSIGNAAFSCCRSLTHIIIPDSVTSIGGNSFSNCSSLSSITLSNNLKSISSGSFYECHSLSSIIIPDSVMSIGAWAFEYCTKLTSVSIPDSVTSIGEGAFDGCVILANVIIPNSVTSIGKEAFMACISLTSITIQDSEISIGEDAFKQCSGLTRIVVLPETPPIIYRGTFNTFNNCSIYVPAGSVEVYKKAVYWSDYADRIQGLAPVPEAVDLGLPSEVKWASFNLGASKPEEYGDYYAWGETESYYSSLDPLTWKPGKERGYYWPSYKWCMGSNTTMTKYCTESKYGYNGFTDGKTVLDPEDDAAHVNLGGNWRMPTDAEWTELRDKCTWTWTTQNGVNGYLVTGPNGNSIFLPAAGLRNNTHLDNAGSTGYFWSSSLNTDDPFTARDVKFHSGYVGGRSGYRDDGRSVRPVTE